MVADGLRVAHSVVDATINEITAAMMFFIIWYYFCLKNTNFCLNGEIKGQEIYVIGIDKGKNFVIGELAYAQQ